MASIAYVTHGRVIALESEYRALTGAAPPIAASSHFAVTLVLYLAPVVMFARAPSLGAVIISIGAAGSGIPEAIRDRVFEPFFTTKDVGHGTGQGLHIARRVIVEQHGGAIWFDSTPGEGTTFFIRLPVQQPSEAAAEPGGSGTLTKASPAA
jgi:signal transduction histidine kinase